jgi:hypothetical protein
MRALDAGPLEELKSRYGQGLTAKGFTRHDECGPAVIFKIKNRK